MTRIEELFKKKASNILNVYCTAGFPKLESTLTVMKALQDSGADIIELGMPYSDPLADGPVIQASGSRALANGMTISVLFSQLRGMRKEISIPVILMGYMNPVLQYGFERFCKDAADCGIDGLILPDLPMFEFENEYRAILRKNNLDFIFLVTPETPAERIRKLDELSSGFLYAVSSSSTTGRNKNIDDQAAYFDRLKTMDLKNPVVVGFGIKDRKSFQSACRHASGAIIGTEFINRLEKGKENINDSVGTFIKEILAEQI